MRIGNIGKDRELITTGAGKCVGSAQPRFYPSNDFLQHQVSYAMTEGVVYLFEIVEVQGKNSYLVMLPVSASQGLFKPVFEKPPIGHSG